MKRLVLVDFNNFIFKSMKKKGLSHLGNNTHVVYNFFRTISSLILTMEKDGYFVDVICCYDAGYDSRYNLSEDAVRRKIIAKTYKEDRRYKYSCLSDVEKEEEKDNKRQIGIIKEILKKTRIKQALINKEEADDVIGSLAKQNKKNYDSIVMVTSDKDYYQLLDKNICIYNSILDKWITEEDFKKEFGLESPLQWIDRGALMGDNGDTIIGINGCGEVKSLKLIKEHKTIDNLIEYAKKITKPIVDEKYNGSYLAVLEAISQKNFSSQFDKLYFQIVAQEELLRIAYILKKIKIDLNVSLIDGESNANALVQSFKDCGFNLPDYVTATLIKFKSVLTPSVLNKIKEKNENKNENYIQKELF